jgi:predicted ArsR family transcriptional regulator
MEHLLSSFVNCCIFWSVNEPAASAEASSSDVEAVATLAEPTRRQLYRVVSRAPAAVSREQVAELADVPVHTAKFHLDKLVDEGLLEVEFHKLTGREGPGSGRPTKHYRRADREVAISLPARQYDLLSRILANAIAQSTADGSPVDIAASKLAHAEGEAFGRTRPATAGDDLTRVAAALTDTGYEPRQDEREVVTLHNCPFHKAAAEQTDLVCGLNLDFVTGVCAGLEAGSVEATLQPEQGRCCVVLASPR